MAKNYVTNFRGDFTPNGKYLVKEEPVTPIEEDFGDHNHMDNSYESDRNGMRKSLSMSDIAALREDLMSLNLNSIKEEVYQRYRRPTGGPQELSRTKFVSMAEAIYHFQRDTPGRFHSSRPRDFQTHGTGQGRSGLTVPQSPMLRCKGRSRPMHILSQKEKEEMEVEEIKKFKIKANPIPKSVIDGSKNLPEVTKKPVTVPEPFKLTEINMNKKIAQSPDQITFKARPAPKHILAQAQVPIKPPVHITKPKSPKFHYKRANSVDRIKPETKLRMQQKSAEKPKPVQRHGPLRPEPFSFERRDEEMKRRREERIKQQIEEERKQASQFKAQPLPGAVKIRMRSATAKGSSSTASSENKENYIKFEARPPLVLYKEPFKPVHQPLHMLKTVPFNLTTGKRAQDREKFDRQLKEKEDEQERMRQMKEKEQQEVEEKAEAELRTKLVHHAKPVPMTITHPFVPERSGAPLTVPETPKFVRKLKQK